MQNATRGGVALHETVLADKRGAQPSAAPSNFQVRPPCGSLVPIGTVVAGIMARLQARRVHTQDQEGDS